MASKNMSGRHSAALAAFEDAGGPVRLVALRKIGVHVQTVRELVDWGVVRKLGRGLYAAAEAPQDGLDAYADAAARHPDGVITGLSAAWLHGLLEHEPDHIEVSLPRRQRSAGRGTREPTVGSGDSARPLRTRSVQEDRLADGVVRVVASGAMVPVTDPARTVADIMSRSALRTAHGDEIMRA